jgi:hypothetical protein
MEQIEPNGPGAGHAAQGATARYRLQPLTNAEDDAMYQPTLGRFLSRDPLSETGVDVLTDTGFYGDRLAAMRANPWFVTVHPFVSSFGPGRPARWASMADVR